jgi:hypothetical protein
MDTHTPGPWTTHKAKPNPWWTVLGPDARPVADVDAASVQAFNKPGNPKIVEANARLIAAAPDLLEVLQAVVSWHDQAEDGAPTDWADVVLHARAAIAKAVRA